MRSNLLLGGDGGSLMLLLRMAGAPRDLAARLLAGPGDLLEIADAGRAIARFDSITDEEVEAARDGCGSTPIIARRWPLGDKPWPAPPLIRGRSSGGSTAPAG